MVEPEFAIRVVFNDRQFQGVTGSGQLLAHLGRQGLASGILEIGQQVQKARGVVQLLTLQNVQLHLAAVRVVGNAAYRGAINRKRLQRTQIGRRLYGDAAAFVDKHLAHKVERLLRTCGDQHLIRRNAPGQRLRHPLAQGRVAFAGGVLQGCVWLLAHDRCIRGVERLHRKRFGSGQSSREADDMRLLGDLEDFADHRRVHATGARGQRPVFHGFHPWSSAMQHIVRGLQGTVKNRPYHAWWTPQPPACILSSPSGHVCGWAPAQRAQAVRREVFLRLSAYRPIRSPYRAPADAAFAATPAWTSARKRPGCQQCADRSWRTREQVPVARPAAPACAKNRYGPHGRACACA